MNTMDLNKIAFGVLSAGLLVMIINEIGNLVVHPQHLEESVLAIDTGADAGAATAEKEEEGPSLPVLLAEADPAKGEKVAKKCAACHKFEQGGKHGTGPALFGVLGRDIASADGFSGYSDALLSMEGTWTYEALDAFLANPRGYAKGTKMAFAGLKKPGDRADILVYMRQQHDAPPPLPTE